MKFKTAFILTLIIFCAGGLFAGPFDMISAGDPIIDDLRFLSLSSGKSILSFTFPLSPYEIRNFLEALDKSSMSAAETEAFDRVEKRFIPDARIKITGSVFSLFFTPGSEFEIRARLNDEVSWYPDFPRVPSIISLPLRLHFGSVFQLYMEPGFTMNTDFYNKAGPFVYNSPFDLMQYDWSTPLRAFIAGGGPWWNVQLGRDRLSFGTGYTGNLAVSDNPDFYEFFRYSFFSEYFKYSFLIAQMPLELESGMMDIELYGYIFDEGSTGLRRTMNRYFYMHRIDFSIRKILSIGITEGIMAGNAPPEIRFFNPLMIFHSFYAWRNYDKWNDEGNMVGSLFSAEINWNIIKSLSVYGQFAMNELSLWLETASNPNQPPNGFGYIAGIQYSHSFRKSPWASVFFFEFASTDPYLCLNGSPFSSFIHMRYVYDKSKRYTFMGYPRDLIALNLGARFFNAGALEFNGLLSFVSKGEHDIHYDWQKTPEAFAEKNPSGTAEKKLIASVSSQWKINKFFTLNSSITGIFSLNNNHVLGTNEAGLQAALSVKFVY